ncbi:MAG: DegV family protein [Chloroflexi bacterium]|nr:DegV family protein [Chloroflexota bacterium]
MRIKPVVAFQRGSYRPIGIARTMRGATDRLFQALEQRARSGNLHVCVHHTNARDAAAALAERVQTSLQPAELLVSEFTQVMGVHTGPGLLGFAFYSDE